MVSSMDSDTLRRLAAMRYQVHGFEILQRQTRNILSLTKNASNLPQGNDVIVESRLRDCSNKTVAIYGVGASPKTQRRVVERAYHVWFRETAAVPEHSNFIAKLIEYKRDDSWARNARILTDITSTHNAMCARYAALQEELRTRAPEMSWDNLNLTPVFKSVLMVIAEGAEDDEDPSVYLVDTGKREINIDLKSHFRMSPELPGVAILPLSEALRYVAAKHRQTESLNIIDEIQTWCHSMLEQYDQEYTGPPITWRLLREHRDDNVYPAILFRSLRCGVPGRLFNSEADGIPSTSCKGSQQPM